MEHKLSLNALVFALVMGALVCFGATVLYGAWSNKLEARRQNLREYGVRPNTESDGSAVAVTSDREKGREREDDGD